MWLPRQRLAGSLNCVQEVRYAVATTRVGPASDVIHDRGANSASLKRIQRWRKKFELMRAASYNMARAALDSLMIHMTSVRIQWGGLRISLQAVVTVWRTVPGVAAALGGDDWGALIGLCERADMSRSDEVFQRRG